MERILVLLFASLAAIMDLKTGKIQNSLIVCGWVTVLAVHLVQKPFLDSWIFGSILPIALGLVLYRFRMLGAGDLKLLSVLGGFMGIPTLWTFLFAVLCFGGMLSVLILSTVTGIGSRCQYVLRYTRELLAGGDPGAYRKGGTEQAENFHFTIPVLMAAILYAGGLF